VASTPPEIRRGLWFWIPVIGGILVAEAAGAVRNWKWFHWMKIPWTTISGMVGHWEDQVPEIAVVVVAVIAAAACFAVSPQLRDTAAKSPVGRWIQTDPGRHVWWYPVWLALLLSAAGGALAIALTDGRDDYSRSYGIYGSLAFFGILVPHVLRRFDRKAPFTPLFETLRGLQRLQGWRAAVTTIALGAGLSILTIHLALYPWPDITKEPVEYAGLKALDARDKAKATIKKAGRADELRYSAQAREVVEFREAWSVFFRNVDPSKAGCVVTVRKDKDTSQDVIDAKACGIP
jgi:hypothetical protein